MAEEDDDLFEPVIAGTPISPNADPEISVGEWLRISQQEDAHSVAQVESLKSESPQKPSKRSLNLILAP